MWREPPMGFGRSLAIELWEPEKEWRLNYGRRGNKWPRMLYGCRLVLGGSTLGLVRRMARLAHGGRSKNGDA